MPPPLSSSTAPTFTVALALLFDGSASASSEDIETLTALAPSVVPVTLIVNVVLDCASKVAATQSIWLLVTVHVPSGQLALLARGFVAWLRDDMHDEETHMLSPSLLRDDVVDASPEAE